MLNKCLLARLGFDTAENEPFEVSYKGFAIHLCLAWSPYLRPRYLRVRFEDFAKGVSVAFWLTRAGGGVRYPRVCLPKFGMAVLGCIDAKLCDNTFRKYSFSVSSLDFQYHLAEK